MEEDASKQQYVLSINYKGKPTHHLVTPGDDGNLVSCDRVDVHVFARLTLGKKPRTGCLRN